MISSISSEVKEYKLIIKEDQENLSHFMLIFISIEKLGVEEWNEVKITTIRGMNI